MLKLSPVSEHSAIYRLNSIISKAQRCSEYRLFSSISCFIKPQKFFEYAKLYDVKILHNTKFQKGPISLILPSPNLFTVELTEATNFPTFLSHINVYLNIQMYLIMRPSEYVINTMIDNLDAFDILNSKHLGNSDMIYLVDFDDANEADLPLEGYFMGNDIRAPWKI